MDLPNFKGMTKKDKVDFWFKFLYHCLDLPTLEDRLNTVNKGSYNDWKKLDPEFEEVFYTAVDQMDAFGAQDGDFIEYIYSKVKQ